MRLWVVRRPVELEGYKPPLELMRILPSVPKASRKRESGQKIGPNHDDFVQVFFLIMLFDVMDSGKLHSLEPLLRNLLLGFPVWKFHAACLNVLK